MNSPGIALFNGATLVHAERVKIPTAFAELDDGERWLRVSHLVVLAAKPHLNSQGVFHEVIFERPQWYKQAKSKGDPNQLAGVAAVGSTTIGILSTTFSIEVFSPKPSEWVGQLPKTCPKCKANKKSCAVCHGSAWETPRGRRIRSRLTEDELRHCPDQNDAIDAVGLGLWARGRFTPVSVFSNGRDGR